MKKMIISGAIALFSLTTLTAMAQNPAQQNNATECQPVNCENTQCNQVQCFEEGSQAQVQQRHKGKKNKKDKKGGRKDRQGASAAKGKKGGDRQAALFQGITLTPEQQSKITALQTRQREDAAKQRAEVKKERTETREKYQKELSKILTPEQYAAYQANVTKMRANSGQQRHGIKGCNGKKGQKRHSGTVARKQQTAVVNIPAAN